MTIDYWKNAARLDIKYTCNYKVPLLIKEILFDLSFLDVKYQKNYNHFLKFIRKKELANEIAIESHYYKCQIFYAISNNKIYYSENYSLYNLDIDVLLFAFSFNHKKVVYKRINGDIDFKKLRQYIYVKNFESLYLMSDFLFMESTCFDLDKSIDTTNIFLNEIITLFKGLPFFLSDGQAYREFFDTNNVINTILREDPHFWKDLYLSHFKKFTNSYIKKC